MSSSGGVRTGDQLAAGPGVADEPSGGESTAERVERLGVVSYTNVAPLHWGLEPWCEDGHRVEFVRGVPSELNRALLQGEIDLTLISSVEFLRHRHRLRALPDFSIATLGPVQSVMLFHHRPWEELDGGRIAVTTDSSTSVELLRVLLEADGITAELIPERPRLESMLAAYDGALLIGDAALVEGVARRTFDGVEPLRTDLGEAWYRHTRLPFTFAVWASRLDRPPSQRLVAKLRAARQSGLGHLAEVAEESAARVGITPEVMLGYLASFRYGLTTPDRDGLMEFARLVLPDIQSDELRFWRL